MRASIIAISALNRKCSLSRSTSRRQSLAVPDRESEAIRLALLSALDSETPAVVTDGNAVLPRYTDTYRVLAGD